MNMKQKLVYEEVEGLPIHTLSVVGDWNDWDPTADRLVKRKDGIWEGEVAFPPGKSLYKLAVNGELLLNDPTANLYVRHQETGEWMSVMDVDPETGRRRLNLEPYRLELSRIRLSRKTGEESGKLQRSFVLGRDDQAVLGLQFRAITGIHVVTVAWYTPSGELYRYAENALMQQQGGQEVQLWFWLPLREELAAGRWGAKVFVNGMYVGEVPLGFERAAGGEREGGWLS